jgi:hypothetical protein
MKKFIQFPWLMAVACLPLLLSACSTTGTSCNGSDKTVGHLQTQESKPYRTFNPESGNFEPAPPFGPRGNNS